MGCPPFYGSSIPCNSFPIIELIIGKNKSITLPYPKSNPNWNSFNVLWSAFCFWFKKVNTILSVLYFWLFVKIFILNIENRSEKVNGLT